MLVETIAKEAISRTDALDLAIELLEMRAEAFRYSVRFTSMLPDNISKPIQADIRRWKKYQAAIELLNRMKAEEDGREIPF